MKHVNIGDFVERVQTWNPQKEGGDSPFQYIDIGAVSQIEKAITEVQTVRAVEAPSRARQIVRAGDILVSTVRPNLNAVAVVPDDLDGATASTGFTVLRPNERKLSGNFLFHWVRSPAFITEMIRQATGQSYPAVSDKIVKASRIPFLSLSEQKRIAGILDQADTLRRLRSRALDKLDTLGQAIFHEMFGEALQGSFFEFGQAVEEFRYGTSNKSGDAGLPTLRIPNVIGGGIDVTEIKTVEVNSAELERLRLRNGDVLFVRTNGNPDYVGRCAEFSFADVAEYNAETDWIFASYLIRARLSDRINPAFAKTYFASQIGRAAVRERCKTSAGQYNINTEGLASLPFPDVPRADQDQFAEVLAAIEQNSAPMKRSAAKMNEKFASLQYRAFNGEL